MSKKTCLHHTAYLKKGSTRCPIHRNGEQISHVCWSCNVTGRSCQNIDDLRRESDCGDYAHNKIHDKVKRSEGSKISRSSQNFASGDYMDKANQVQKIFGNNHEVTRKINEEKSSGKGQNTDVTVEYMNKKYDDSKSSTNSSLCSLIKNSYMNTDKMENDVQDTKAIRRPVFCPVTNCAKSVAIDSIMSHFYFDHSKVPRITLITVAPQDFDVKCNISSETGCLAMILIKKLGRSSQVSQNSDSVSHVNNLSHNNKLLLLMAVKLQISALKLSQFADSQHVLKRIDCLQPYNIDYHKDIEINKNQAKVYETVSNLNINRPESYGNDDLVLFWLCKLDDEEKTYTIIISRKDHKLSYGYTGDAIHVKEKQDPLSIYERPECLMVRGKAINKLLDNDHNIKIIVNCID